MYIVEIKNKYGNCLMGSFRTVDAAMSFAESVAGYSYRYQGCTPRITYVNQDEANVA